MYKKLRLIYFPFLILGACVIGLCTLLHWFILILFQDFEIREEIVKLWLPILLSSVGAYIFLNPRIKLLKVSEKVRCLFLVLAIAVIAIPTVISQEHLSKAFGELTPLSTISAIETAKKTRYYSLKEAFVSKKDTETHLSVESRGRYNERLSVSLYLAIPIYDSFKLPQPMAWLGMKYHEEIGNMLSDVEKERRYEEFLDQCEKDFNACNVQKFTYLERMGPSYGLDSYVKALKKSPKYSKGNNIVLISHETPFEARTENSVKWLVLSHFFGALFFFVMLLFPKVSEEELIMASKNEWLEMLIPKANYFVTPLLIILNCGIFIIMGLTGIGFMSMESEGLLQWGANFGPAVNQGEYWRLLTSTFLHGGILHLVANMTALYYAGICVEPFLGRLKMVFTYCVFGVAASLTSFYISGNLSVGASGAILGLYGFGLTLFYLTKALEEELKSVFLNILGTIAIVSIVMGFILPGIDNAAHIGGFLSGCFFGLLFSKFGTFAKDTGYEECA